MLRSKIINAIDIGTTKITSLVAQHLSEDGKLNIIGIATAPARGFRRGQVVNIEEATSSLVASVEAAERMASTPIRKAYVGIAAPHLGSLKSTGVVAVAEPEREITSFDVEKVLEAARAVSLPKNSSVLHVVPRQFIVDGQEGIVDPLRMTGVRLEVSATILTASTAAINNLRKVLLEAGVTPSGLIYNGFASAETVLSPTEQELGSVLLDIGGTVTSITVFTEGSPVFIKVLPVGSVNVTNDLAIGLRLPLEEAEKLKIFLSRKDRKIKRQSSAAEIGISGHRDIDLEVALNGIVQPRLEEICQLVRDELQQAKLLGSAPAGVVITGGGGLLPNLTVIAQQVIGLPVRIGYPHQLGGIAEEITAPAYSSALGLLEHASKNDGGENKSPLVPTFSFFHNADFKGTAGRILNILRPLLP